MHFPLERVDYLELTLEIQGVIEGVVRGFRKAVIENQPRHYKTVDTEKYQNGFRAAKQ